MLNSIDANRFHFAFVFSDSYSSTNSVTQPDEIKEIPNFSLRDFESI